MEAGRTRVPLELAAQGSAFIVLRRPTTVESLTIAKRKSVPLATLSDGWTLAFQSGRGAPEGRRDAELGRWDESPDPGVRYFSGTAAYRRQIWAPDAWFRGRGRGRLVLDLGEVDDLAQVRINGRSAGILWRAPYQADVTGLLRPGRNQLEIRVTNLWVNRLIGDQQPGARRFAKTAAQTYTADAALRRSGLVGPVALALHRADVARPGP
jgi:hypothetical protein